MELTDFYTDELMAGLKQDLLEELLGFCHLNQQLEKTRQRLHGLTDLIEQGTRSRKEAVFFIPDQIKTIARARPKWPRRGKSKKLKARS